jgi:methionyl-tRNA formyltransferase
MTSDQEPVSIGPDETAQDDSQATYFGGRKPEDGRIHWTGSAVEVFNLIRAVTHPYPNAFTRTRRTGPEEDVPSGTHGLTPGERLA